MLEFELQFVQRFRAKPSSSRLIQLQLVKLLRFQQFERRRTGRGDGRLWRYALSRDRGQQWMLLCGLEQYDV